MNYLDIGHDNYYNGYCWFYKDKLLLKENTSHEDWVYNLFKDDNYACGRIDEKKNLISFVGYSLNPTKAEFIKKQLQKKFTAKIIDLTPK